MVNALLALRFTRIKSRMNFVFSIACRLGLVIVIDLVARDKALVKVNLRAAAARSIDVESDSTGFGHVVSRTLKSRLKSIFFITNLSFSVLILNTVTVGWWSLIR